MSQSWKDQFPHQNHKQDMLSEAEHWWNHLTFAQREFCTKEYKNKEYSLPDSGTVSWSYASKEFLHSLEGWPETPMRSV